MYALKLEFGFEGYNMSIRGDGMANRIPQYDMNAFIGQKFDMLTVIKYSHSVHKKHNVNRYYECKCDCGNTCIRARSYLITKFENVTKSCGCYRKISRAIAAKKIIPKHGMSHSRLYNIYRTMLKRCYSPSHDAYPNYGGRGIVVCDEWSNKDDGFIQFAKWAFNNGYIEQDKNVDIRDRLSLERKNVNDNYCPENCTWIPLWKQGANKQNSRTLTICGTVYNLVTVAYALGYNPKHLADCKHTKKQHWSDAAIVLKFLQPELKLHMDRHGQYRDHDGFEVLINPSLIKIKLDKMLSKYEKES